MRALAIETATTACAIALDDGELVIERVLDTSRRHTEVLTPGIEALLAERSITARDLARVVVDHGPGLFTGLRVGIAAAQALARGLGVELVEVTSLELLAASAHRDGHRGRLTALVDARRGELFAQSFELGEGVVARGDASVIGPSDLVARWRGESQRPVLVGDGAARYRDLFEFSLEVTVLDIVVPSPREALAIGERRAPVELATPLYLRDADAVSNFAVRKAP